MSSSGRYRDAKPALRIRSAASSKDAGSVLYFFSTSHGAEKRLKSALSDSGSSFSIP